MVAFLSVRFAETTIGGDLLQIKGFLLTFHYEGQLLVCVVVQRGLELVHGVWHGQAAAAVEGLSACVEDAIFQVQRDAVLTRQPLVGLLPAILRERGAAKEGAVTGPIFGDLIVNELAGAQHFVVKLRVARRLEAGTVAPAEGLFHFAQPDFQVGVHHPVGVERIVFLFDEFADPGILFPDLEAVSPQVSKKGEHHFEHGTGSFREMKWGLRVAEAHWNPQAIKSAE